MRPKNNRSARAGSGSQPPHRRLPRPSPVRIGPAAKLIAWAMIGLTVNGMAPAFAMNSNAARHLQDDIIRDGKQKTIAGYCLALVAHGKLNDLDFMDRLLGRADTISFTNGAARDQTIESRDYSYSTTVQIYREAINNNVTGVRIWFTGQDADNEMNWLKTEIIPITVQDVGPYPLTDGGGTGYSVWLQAGHDTSFLMSVGWDVFEGKSTQGLTLYQPFSSGAK